MSCWFAQLLNASSLCTGLIFSTQLNKRSCLGLHIWKKIQCKSVRDKTPNKALRIVSIHLVPQLAFNDDHYIKAFKFNFTLTRIKQISNPKQSLLEIGPVLLSALGEFQSWLSSRPTNQASKPFVASTWGTNSPWEGKLSIKPKLSSSSKDSDTPLSVTAPESGDCWRRYSEAWSNLLPSNCASGVVGMLPLTTLSQHEFAFEAVPPLKRLHWKRQSCSTVSGSEQSLSRLTVSVETLL